MLRSIYLHTYTPHMHTYTYTYTHIHTYAHTHIHTYAYTWSRMYLHTCLQARSTCHNYFWAQKIRYFYNFAHNFWIFPPIKKPFNSDQLGSVGFQMRPIASKSVQPSPRNTLSFYTLKNHIFKYNFWTTQSNLTKLYSKNPQESALSFDTLTVEIGSVNFEKIELEGFHFFAYNS